MGLPLLDDAYFHAERRGRVIVAVRSEVGFASLEDVADAHRRFAEVVEALPRNTLALYLDLRQAPSRNDPGFEETLAPFRTRFLSGWGRVAIVVRSVVGGLQVRRHANEDGTDVHVFDDADAALAFVGGVGGP